jgi:DNA mismatch repair protein MutS
LVNANRYITNELKDYEQKIIEANEQKSNLEYELFLNIRDQVLSKADNIIELSYNISFIDFISSQAYVSDLYNFNRPELTESFDLNIKSARHPIIENSVDDFISNDLNLNKSEFIHIIT